MATLQEKIDKLKWFPDLPYKLKEIFQEITTFNILPLSNIFTGIKNVFSGNVGVGTENPSGKVHIISEATSNPFIYETVGGQPRIKIRRASGTKTAPTASVAGNSSLIQAEFFDGTNYINNAYIQFLNAENTTPTNAGSKIALFSAKTGTVTPAVRMLVDENGNVGINTTYASAAARLEILADASQSSTALFKVGLNVVIDSNERLAIGTTTPTSKLQVVGLPVHADNTAALGAGLTAGAFYHNGDGVVRVAY